MMESIAESLQQQQQQQALSRQQSAATVPSSEAQVGHRRQSSTSSMASLEVAAINGGNMMTKNMNASSKSPNFTENFLDSIRSRNMHSPQIHPPTCTECGTLRFAEHWSASPSYTAASSARSSKDCLKKRSPLAWILSPGPRNRSLRKRLQWTGNSLRSNISSFCGSRQVKIIIFGRVYQSQRIRRVIPKHKAIQLNNVFHFSADRPVSC